MRKNVTVTLTDIERRALVLCLSGEVENEDGMHGDYFRTLRRVLKKLER